MADFHVLSALEDKAHKLRSAIVSYEEHLERTRRELAVITATIAIFARGGVASTDGRPAPRSQSLQAGRGRQTSRAGGEAEAQGGARGPVFRGAFRGPIAY